MPKTIYLVAGEASGDNHGASLMRSLRQIIPEVSFAGRGGPQMKATAGSGFRDWIGRAGVVGLWDVLKNYRFFRREFRETLEEIERDRPDAVVLIDYPGFNLRLARALRRRTSGPRLIYYISPQVWAWNRGRIKKMARWLDLMLCIFPFEADLYNKSGLRTIFVGHPMPESLEALKEEAERDPNLVALIPGSRRREIRKIFPIMLRTARELRRHRPQLRFEVAAARPELAQRMDRHLQRMAGDWAFVSVKTGATAGIMQRAQVGIVASGSATLEAAYFRLPFVLIYKVAWPTYLAGRIVVQIDFLGMPNVLANRPVVPEFIQHEARPIALAEAVGQLLDSSSARSEMTASFGQIMHSLGERGASERAAVAIAAELDAL